MSFSKNNNEIYIFIGPPGAGKGSLSQLFLDDFGWVQLSTGNLCRKHIEEQTKIGKEIDFTLKSGKLISDSLITQMVSEWLTDKAGTKTVILDGYPRTVPQAEMFNKLLQDKFGFLKLRIIRLTLPDQEIIKRLGGRYICQNKDCQAVYSLVEGSDLAPEKDMICNRCQSPIKRRKDDDAHAVKERLKTYHKHEQDVLQFYKNCGLPIIEISAEKPLNIVFNELTKLMNLKE